MTRATALMLSAGLTVLCGCQGARMPMMSQAPLAQQAPVQAPVRAQSEAGIKDALKHLCESEFTALDANHDGVVTMAESKMSVADFAKVDANGDQQITVKEQESFYRRIGPGLVEFLQEESAKNFANTDRNVDGQISIAEYRAQLPADPNDDHARFAMSLFNVSDRNHDRALNPSEFEDMEAWFIASLYDLDPVAAAVTAARIRNARTSRR